MFRFRLQPLLRLRTAERDERHGELAKALRAADILREQREQLGSDMADNQELSRKLSLPGSGNVDGLLAAHRYESILKVQSQHLATQEAQVAGEVERRRQVLMEADRQVRMLEKLSERKRLEHSQQELRQETKQLDEVAARNHVRQQEVRQ